MRRTRVVASRLAHRVAVHRAATDRDHGLHVTTLAGLAARLAGPFLRVADAVDVRRAVARVPERTLGELARIAELSGFDRAAAGTLRAAWNAGLDLHARADRGGRWRELADLDAAVRDALPAGARPLTEITERAIRNARHAPAVTGPVHLHRVDHLPPAFRPLLHALSDHVLVRWTSWAPEPPHAPPDGVAHEPPAVHAPDLARVSCADPRHEAVEAFRWARRLAAERNVPPGDVAVIAAHVGPYDEAVLSLAEDADLPLHAADGRPAVAGPDGQAAAALADLILRGLSRARALRFVRTARRAGAPRDLRDLPHDWARRLLPDEAPLATLDRWRRALTDAGDDLDDARATLRALGEDVARGPDHARASGERWLTGRARRLWRRALDEGPAAALDASLERIRVPDRLDPAGAIVWASAADLAAAPRPYVRMLGLASRSWPRPAREDPLLPRHVLGDAVLHDRTVTSHDRRAFHAVLAAAGAEVVLSRPRRDEEARAFAASPLLRDAGVPDAHERPLAPRRLPEHAFSDADRRLARPDEANHDPHARAAREAWRARLRSEATPHDGIVRPDHPVVTAALARTHSATSLRKALRDPLGFVWTYALGWRELRDPERTLQLDPADRGALLHDVLRSAVADLEENGGLAAVGRDAIDRAVRDAVRREADAWSVRKPVPPGLLWNAALNEIADLASAALALPLPDLPDPRTYVEVPFGATGPLDPAVPLPWPADADVRLPNDGPRISGRIDRLDLSGDGRAARVIDYKSTRNPGKPKLRALDVDEGRELQRCLYAFAVRDLLPSLTSIEATLVFPASGEARTLRDPDGTLNGLSEAIHRAMAALRAGNAVPGPDALEDWNDLRLALPADRTRGYAARKERAFARARADVAELLEAEPHKAEHT